jgi:hypothetical protein
MTQLKIDAQMRSKLAGISKMTEFIDDAGNVLGIYTPRMCREPQISAEELARREQDSESFTTAELLAHLEKL